MGDGFSKSGPKVALVFIHLSFTGLAERLARATAGPHGLAIWPACKAKGVTPSPNPGEEMALAVLFKVGWANIFDAGFVNDSWRDMPALDEFS